MLTVIKTQVAQWLEQEEKLNPKAIYSLLEAPKTLVHGQLAFPVFFLAKERRKAPPLIAQDIVTRLQTTKPKGVLKVEAVGGYVNFHFDPSYLQDILMENIKAEAVDIGHSQRGKGQKVIIDFSSPNVAKPMSVGHLRATVIGQAIYNLAKTQGYEVVGLNYIGDWGVQFGKLAWAVQNWGHEYPLKEKPFESLFQMYVRFHEEAEKNPQLEQEGSRIFKRLEDGDPEIRKLWQSFVEISIKDYERLYKLLGVRHDLVQGESFFNERLKGIEKLLQEKGLLVESEGAMVVRLDEEEMPPCLIRKSDGASLYATRDIASAIYRMEELKANINLYVVGVDQSLHFKQVFRVLEKMGYPWVSDCHHIAFGMYKFKDLGRMSTRKGQVIFLEDVLKKAISLVREIIEQKNPTLGDKDRVAEQVGVGAILFNDLVNDRIKNVDFDWERALDFEGDSGPYVQYCVVRCKSLLKKYGQQLPQKMTVALDSPEEQELVCLLLALRDTLSNAFDNYKPHILACYLLDVCRAFSQFYQKHRILGEASDLQASRMALVGATLKVLEQGLRVLSMPSPEAM